MSDIELNYYEILEIKENASQEVIKAAYKALAKKYHPDSFKGATYIREKNMTQINEAYMVLSDEKKREEYDYKLKSQKEKTCSEYSSYNDADRQSEADQQAEKDEYSSDASFTCNAEKGYGDIEKKSDKEETTGGWFGKIVGGIGKEIIRTMQNNSCEIENAYYQGVSLDDYTLIRRFKQARGNQRIGYTKALEERGMLERNYEGNLVPTYRFKHLF